MPTQFSQAKLDFALDTLKRKPCTVQELADEMQCSYQYASVLLKQLKKFQMVSLHSYEGRINRWVASDSLYSIPAIQGNNTIEVIINWLKNDCYIVPNSAIRFNTLFMSTILSLLHEARDLSNGSKPNKDRRERARRALLQYRESLQYSIATVDDVLNNTVWWTPEILAKLTNDPKFPTTEQLTSWEGFAKNKLEALDV